MSTDILFGSKAISNGVVFCIRTRSLAMIKVDPIKCHFLFLFFFSSFSFLFLVLSLREKRKKGLDSCVQCAVADLVSHLDSEFIEPIFFSTILLRRLTLAVIYSIFKDRVRSNQPMARSRIIVSKNRFLRIFPIFIHLFFFYLPATLLLGQWPGVFLIAFYLLSK